MTNVFQAFYGGHFVPLMRRFGAMAVASAVGVIGVAVTLDKLGAPGMTGWLGLLLVLYASLALFAWRPIMPRAGEWWANPLIGVASGLVAGMTGVAAVPFLPYMQSLEMDRHELVQALGIMFLFITGMLAVSLAMHGAYHMANSVAGVAAVAPTMVGVWIGQHARRRLSPETFRRIFIVGMLLVGLHLARALL